MPSLMTGTLELISSPSICGINHLCGHPIPVRWNRPPWCLSVLVVHNSSSAPLVSWWFTNHAFVKYFDSLPMIACSLRCARARTM